MQSSQLAQTELGPLSCRHRDLGGRPIPVVLLLLFLALFATGGFAQDLAGFTNFESPHVHPLDLSPDGTTLAAVNTADNRVELFTVEDSRLLSTGSVFVGLDPVSLRFLSNDELWVVNHISDTVSVVHVPSRRVRATLATGDEPADVVFAGEPIRAFVSCSQANEVWVFNPNDLDQSPNRVTIDAEDPRALAVSPDGRSVYAAVFESGNSTTLVPGGSSLSEVVNLEEGPYGGVNPPPNDGGAFTPAIDASLPPAPPVALIVARDSAGRFRDDNGADWTPWISGTLAPLTKRPIGWELLDRDVAVIDTQTLGVRYLERMLNLCMALAVQPGTGRVTVVGTDALNQVRFEPNLRGVFLRVNLALADPSSSALTLRDLNPHLDYTSSRVPQAQRNLSLGDPRAIVWNRAGNRAFIAGMGSNNVAVVDSGGNRVGNPMGVGQGPTGLALAAGGQTLFVLNRFGASISVIDTGTRTEAQRLGFFDATPAAIRAGRPFLYDTHRTSGLGHVSCASCHPDGRMDRLAWDLGDPRGSLKSTAGRNKTLFDGDLFADWHPMKGPMVTQTLQDIIGKEPFHWRGDRDGIEEFNAAFVTLLGDDEELTAAEMGQLKAFLATLHLPPNPFRNLDNSLPTRVPLPNLLSSGNLDQPRGTPMPAGNAVEGEDFFRRVAFCAGCHTLPTSHGTPFNRQGDDFLPIPPGPNGEGSLALIGADEAIQLGFKIPHLRNLYEKVGFSVVAPQSRAGFGFLHDGSQGLTDFLSRPRFVVSTDQELADVLAFVMAFTGSGFTPAPPSVDEPPGIFSRDAHAAVGHQLTLPGSAPETLDTLVSLAQAGAVDLIARGPRQGSPRGWWFRPSTGRWRSDRADQGGETLAQILAGAQGGTETTFTAVPTGSGERLGVDRDQDGLLDFDEVRDLDPTVPGRQNPFDPAARDSTGDNGAQGGDGRPDGANDFDGDGRSNAQELAEGTNPLQAVEVSTVGFAESFVTADESSGTAVVVVERSGGTEALSVTWSAQGLSATAGEDFSTAAGTLQWSAGDTETKTLTIPLLDDATVELVELLRVTLDGASGNAVIASPQTLAVAILDDDGGSGCSASPESLCLLNDRLQVSVDWRNYRNGAIGRGGTKVISGQSGSFWFFNERNTELIVKALDGRPVNDHLWLFYGALSEVEYWISVVDTETGEVKVYANEAENLCGLGDNKAFFRPLSSALAEFPEEAPRSLPAAAGGDCSADPSTLCLLDDRFEVRVAWNDTRNQRTGVGTAVPDSNASGLFWFFNAANIELVVKVLDGRPVNGKFWVFYGALSDVEYTITVTDRMTGAVKEYRNPTGNLCGQADTGAFVPGPGS